MNIKFFIGLVFSSLILFSCGQKKEVTYSKYSSDNNTYSVEIPSSATQVSCIADLMSFENNNSHLIITIEHINEGSIEEYIRNKDITNNTFSYNLFQSSDTTYFYKITRGNNLWSAYDLYMLKRLKERNYLIKVSSDVIGQSEMIEMIKHIYTSMKLNEIEEDDVVDDTTKKAQAVSLEKTFSTRSYSVNYPKGWHVQEHLDEITDVYIGYQPENFGFTIVHFETDYSLSEVNAEGNENLKQSGFRVLEEKQMKVDGVKCYKAVYEISLQGQKVKHISYTFKKSDMLYNVKFGSVTTKTQETLAADIIDSFRFEL